MVVMPGLTCCSIASSVSRTMRPTSRSPSHSACDVIDMRSAPSSIVPAPGSATVLPWRRRRDILPEPAPGVPGSLFGGRQILILGVAAALPGESGGHERRAHVGAVHFQFGDGAPISRAVAADGKGLSADELPQKCLRLTAE